MSKEYSAGAVIFHQEKGQRKYLLLHYRHGHWGHARGHIEEGEGPKQTAQREIREETGLSDLKFVPDFKVRGGFISEKKLNKDIIYFLAQTKTRHIRIDPREHKGYGWFSYKEAIERATFINSKNLLRQAEQFLAGKRGDFKLVIMAGGGGKRLWPISRRNNPKQIQPLIGQDTLLQSAYKRIKKEFPKSNIFISTNINNKYDVEKQLPGLSFDKLILEPQEKDTAAAIGLAAMKLYWDNPRNILATINSDAHIKDEQEYSRILKLAERAVRANPQKTVLIGIKPSYPETGYGYIKLGRKFKKIGRDNIFRAEKFVEKPGLVTAKRYLKSGKYLWNPAMFVWRVDHLLDLYQKHLPEMFERLFTIYKSFGGKNERQTIKNEFSRIKPISVDYGIMEKIGGDMLVIPADFGWRDIGSWRAVKEVLSEDNYTNVTKGRCLLVDCRGNLIYNFTNGLVSVLGLENMAVIKAADVLLVCPLERAQDIKKIVDQLEKNKLDKYL